MAIQGQDERLQIAQRLAGIFDAEGAALWLLAPHPLLGHGRRPCDEPADKILELIEQLETGAFV